MLRVAAAGAVAGAEAGAAGMACGRRRPSQRRQIVPTFQGRNDAAFGMPVGGDIEYTAEVTLGRALSGRVQM